MLKIIGLDCQAVSIDKNVTVKTECILSSSLTRISGASLLSWKTVFFENVENVDNVDLRFGPKALKRVARSAFSSVMVMQWLDRRPQLRFG